MGFRTRVLRIIKNKIFSIVVIITLAIAEIILYNFVKSQMFKIRELYEIEKTALFVFKLFLIGVFIIVLFLCFLNHIYKEKCGRKSLIIDIIHYKKSIIFLFRFFSESDPKKLKTTSFPIVNWKKKRGVLFGYTGKDNLIYKPSYSEMNIAVFGSPGSSKTVSYVKPNARQFNGAVLAVDIKGDIYEYNKNYRNIIRFAPDIPNAIYKSAHFNPFAGISKLSKTELKLFVSNMSEILIPNDSEKDTYFSKTARKLFCGILLLLLEVCPNLTFPEFLHAVLHYQKPTEWKLGKFPSNVFEWIECVAYSPYPEAVEQVSAMVGNNEKNISGVSDRLATALVPFSNGVLDVLLDGNGDCITADALYNGTDVYLQISQSNLFTYAPLFTLIINSFMTDFSNRPDTAFNTKKNIPILCILDEFPQLSFPYLTINQFLSTLRSKSVIIMLVCQSISQLAKKYDNYGYQALLGNCKFLICCKSNDPITQDYFKKIIGTKKGLKYSDISITEIEEPVYTNADFGVLKDTAIIYYDGYHTELYKIKSYK